MNYDINNSPQVVDTASVISGILTSRTLSYSQYDLWAEPRVYLYPRPFRSPSPSPNLVEASDLTGRGHAMQHNNVCSDSVITSTINVTVKPSLKQCDSLALDWLFSLKSNSLSDRVLARLIQSEAHEALPYLKDDYRQAFITVSLAAKANTDPFVVASYTMYGLHPSKVWPRILANRQARLADEFQIWYDTSGMPKPDCPKKESVGASKEPLTAHKGA